MLDLYVIAAGWLGLAILAAVLSTHLKISIVLIEICVGAIAALCLERYVSPGIIGVDQEWLKFLASIGSVLLTFLAGAELEPRVLQAKWKEVTFVGLTGFFAPFLGCAALAHWVLGWTFRSSLLAGVALSTTSVAVVYAVMLETGFNRTGFGKGILGACFVNDLGTVIALGLIFAPFTIRSVVMIAATLAVLWALPRFTHALTARYAYRTAAIRTKWILFVLFVLGALSIWAGNEAVLPAYLVGMMLAGWTARDNGFVKRIRTLTMGFLTPFYFLRAGSLVSIPAVAAAPLVFLALLGGKVVSKIAGLVPVIGRFREHRKEVWYYTLMMSTGLTFGTISSMYGLSHGIIDRAQYSFLVAAVIGSAVVPTAIAQARFFPHHLVRTRRALRASSARAAGTTASEP